MKLFALLAFFACVPSAFAFTINYNSSSGYAYSGWTTRTVTFDTNLSQCSLPVNQITAAINQALDIWNGVPSSSLSVKSGSTVSTTASAAKSPGGPGNPVIVCDTNFSADTGADGNFVPAAASITWADGGKHISNAVLFLNSEVGKNANIANFDVNLLTIIMAHEIGHSLGLGHSSDLNALMYYNASAKTELNLAKDDVDGISFLYPRNELSGSSALGCNSIEKSSRNSFHSGEKKSSKQSPLSDQQSPFLEFALLLSVFYFFSRAHRSSDNRLG